MKTLNFQGYSDDTFGTYGADGVDHDNCAKREPITFLVKAGDHALYVSGEYAPGGRAGTWAIGTQLVDESAPLPPWPMHFCKSQGAPYTHALAIDVPDEATVTYVEFQGAPRPEPVPVRADGGSLANVAQRIEQLALELRDAAQRDSHFTKAAEARAEHAYRERDAARSYVLELEQRLNRAREESRIVAQQREEARLAADELRGEVKCLKADLASLEAGATLMVGASEWDEVHKQAAAYRNAEDERDRAIQRAEAAEEALRAVMERAETAEAREEKALAERTACKNIIPGVSTYPCCMCERCETAFRPEARADTPVTSDVQSPERGVAGDRCEQGNECGRVGCPECQQ